ncbi:MAG: FapA family protein [Deltaproteobacteria bacterium]
MSGQVIVKNEFIQIELENDDFFIQSFKSGFSLGEFNHIIEKNPQIKITSFTVVKSAIVFAPKAKEKFGELKEKIMVEVSSDGLKAYIILNAVPDELALANRENLKKQILYKLSASRVVFGIKNEVLLGELENERKILIAEGTPPENGKDSIITLYELKEAKPKVTEGQNVDHYDLSLINRVMKDEWLGERIDATLGTSGKNVYGNDIAPIPGNTINLEYDKMSVYEIREDNKTVLHSLYTGAVSYINGQISVSNHLEVAGNVDFSTGNIDFDGCVTIKGTIDDNFQVIADGDIEILGELGVGNIKAIESRQGSIYIKGGISCKNKVTIRAARNIFVKYASNVTLVAGHMVNVGYYCLNSELKAKEVYIESSKGQVMGGAIEASARVVVNTLGSPSEKRTLLRVKGINKELIKQEIESIASQLEADRNELAKLKSDLNTANEKKEAQARVSILKDKINKLNDQIKLNEEEKKMLNNIVKVRGDGEVIIIKKMYPNCSIEIGSHSKEIMKEQPGAMFFVSDGEIKQA